MYLVTTSNSCQQHSVLNYTFRSFIVDGKAGGGKAVRENGKFYLKIGQDTDSVIYEEYQIHKESRFVLK